VDNAPPARDGGRPDISRADYTWCLTAIDWGWGIEETAAQLLHESSKAQENGESYAMRTARNAAAAVRRRQAPNPVPNQVEQDGGSAQKAVQPISFQDRILQERQEQDKGPGLP
jgi:hypothetical protein